MGTSPAVSIVMAVYNGAKFLPAAIESIRTQTLRNWEAIIVDDGSTDDTAAILESTRTTDPRFRIYRTARQGQTKALNQALTYVEGEAIARLDQDDWMLPERLEKQHAFLACHPDVGLLGSDVWVANSAGTRVGRICRPADDLPLRRALIRGNPFVHSAVMVRTSALHAVGAYDERFLAAQDYELWMRVAARYRLASLPEPLASLRKHQASTSARMARRQVIEVVKVQIGAIRRRQYPLIDARHIVKWLLYWPQPALADWALQTVRQARSHSENEIY